MQGYKLYIRTAQRELKLKATWIGKGFKGSIREKTLLIIISLNHKKGIKKVQKKCWKWPKGLEREDKQNEIWEKKSISWTWGHDSFLEIYKFTLCGFFFEIEHIINYIFMFCSQAYFSCVQTLKGSLIKKWNFLFSIICFYYVVDRIWFEKSSGIATQLFSIKGFEAQPPFWLKINDDNSCFFLFLSRSFFVCFERTTVPLLLTIHQQ